MTTSDLFAAIEAGDGALVSSLLNAGADPDAPRADGWTPIFAAAKEGRAEIARLLLDKGADPNRLQVTKGDYEDDYGSGPFTVTFTEFLHPIDLAIAGGHEEIAALLAVRCADPWVRVKKEPHNPYHENRPRRDPVIEAARRGWAVLLDRLLAHAARPADVDQAAVDAALKDGAEKAVEHRRGDVLEVLGRRVPGMGEVRRQQALFAAIQLRHAGALQILFEGLDKQEHRWTEIIRDVVKTDDPKLVQALIPADSWLTPRDIIEAVRRREESGILDLLAAGPEPKADPQAKPMRGPRWLAVHYAALGGHVEALRRLLGRGAAKEEFDYAMKIAIEGRSPECVQYLLEAGAVPSEQNVHDADRFGDDRRIYEALLARAAERGEDRVVTLLLHRRIPLNADAALCRAASRGRKSTADLILRINGLRRVLSETALGEALKEAEGAGHAELAEFLRTAWKT